MKKLQKNEGFTLIELLIVVAIIGIIAAIAVPGLLRARMSGNETSALGSMRAIDSSQVSYSSAAAQGGYAIDLTVLGAPCAGGTQGFISPDLASAATVQKSGFTVTMAQGTGAATGVNDCNGVAAYTNYYATAIPQTANSTGARAFSTDAAGTVWQSTDPTTAPAQPFTASATVSPIQ